MPNLYLIVSAIITNAVWYYTISALGDWIAYTGMIVAIVSSMLSWRFIPKEGLRQVYSSTHAKPYLVSALTTAVCQIVIACYDHKVAAIMTLMWCTWYAISVVTLIKSSSQN